jgi:hypothetical protein
MHTAQQCSATRQGAVGCLEAGLTANNCTHPCNPAVYLLMLFVVCYRTQVSVERVWAGPFMTSLDMAGVSLTLMRLAPGAAGDKVRRGHAVTVLAAAGVAMSQQSAGVWGQRSALFDDCLYSWLTCLWTGRCSLRWTPLLVHLAGRTPQACSVTRHQCPCLLVRQSQCHASTCGMHPHPFPAQAATPALSRCIVPASCTLFINPFCQALRRGRCTTGSVPN